MFRWAKGEVNDLGPHGSYQLFQIGALGAGGMMRKMTSTPVAT
jgi:hypothetical protein